MSRIWACFVLVLALWAGPLSAHETTRSYVTLNREGTQIAVTLRVAFRDIEVVVWMDENLDGAVTWAFIFDGQPWFDGFRDLATNGIAKAVLNAFRMMGKLDGDWIAATSSHGVSLETIMASGVRDTGARQRGSGRRSVGAGAGGSSPASGARGWSAWTSGRSIDTGRRLPSRMAKPGWNMRSGRSSAV